MRRFHIEFVSTIQRGKSLDDAMNNGERRIGFVGKRYEKGQLTDA